MDALIYAQANLLKKNISDLNGMRNRALDYFDSLVAGTSSITDTEYVNMLASMRATLDKYFDGQVAPLNKQFEAL